MSFANGPYSSAISEQDADDFLAEAKGKFQKSCFIAEKDVHWEFPVTLVNADPKNPSMIEVLQEASEAASTPGSIITRTQLPILDSAAKVPGNTMIGIYGLMVYFPLGGIPQTEAEALAIQSVIETCQRSIITFETAGNPFYEIAGHRVFNFGFGLSSGAVGASGADGYIVAPIGVTVGARLKPIILSDQEQLKMKWHYNRSAAWPANSRPRFLLSTQIATGT